MMLAAGAAWAQTPPSQWVFSINFQEAGSSNPRLFTFPDNVEQSLIINSLGTSLSYSRATPRNQLGLNGRLAGNLARDFSDLDNIYYSGGFFWGHQASPRLRTSLTQAFSSGINPQTLTSVGVLPNRLNSQNYQASGGLSYQTSQSSSLTASVSYNWIRFDTFSQIEGSQLVLDLPPFDEDPLETFPGVGAEPEEGTLPTAPDAEQLVLDIIAFEGLQDPKVTSQSARAQLGFSHQLSEKTTTSFGAFYGLRSFDSQTLTNGPQYGGSATLGRRISPYSSVSLGYRIQRNLSQDPGTTTHRLTGGWNQTLRRQLPEMSLNASGGVGYFQASGLRSGDMSFIANLGLSSQLTRTTAFSIRYSRQYRQALGFGRNFLTDNASANITQSIGSRIQIGASGNYSRGRDPLEPGSLFTGERYTGYVSFRITGGLSVGGSYQNWITSRQTEGILSSQDSNIWSVFLGYTKSWPR